MHHGSFLTVTFWIWKQMNFLVHVFFLTLSVWQFYWVKYTEATVWGCLVGFFCFVLSVCLKTSTSKQTWLLHSKHPGLTENGVQYLPLCVFDHSDFNINSVFFGTPEMNTQNAHAGGFLKCLNFKMPISKCSFFGDLLVTSVSIGVIFVSASEHLSTDRSFS